MTVIVVSNIVPHEGREEEVLAILGRAVPQIQSSAPGCELYAIHRGRGRSRGRLCLLEKWSDADSFRAYGDSPTLHKLHAELEDMIDSLEDYHVFGPLPLGTPEQGAI